MLKMKRIGLCFVVCVGLLLGPAFTAWSGVYSGNWSPTSNSVQYFNVTWGDMIPDLDFNFFLYNKQTNDRLNVFSQSGFLDSAAVQFSADKGSYWAKLGSKALELGSSPIFGLGFNLGQGEMYEYSYGLLSNNDQYQLSLGDQKALISSDASPTPLPASLWLLGSALVGLVSIRRKFMNALS